MKVKQLQALLANEDPDAEVVIAGFETHTSPDVAEADLIIRCKTVPSPEDSMMGNRKLQEDGASSVWIGWSKDYRTEYFLGDIKGENDVY